MWTCRRWSNTISIGDMLDKLEWPSLETRREKCSIVSLEKDKNLTPAPNLRRTTASHDSHSTQDILHIVMP